ncbi:MAG: hypothetical protein N3G21_09845 [Candidatus Hydrogenedentes bacterium]|nr:hypothetical protein [Candidatus Hydrogenedentota bacterium]
MRYLFSLFVMEFILVFCSLLLLSCGTVRKIEIPIISSLGQSDEQKIVSILDTLERAIEEKKIKTAMRYISTDYRDEQGRDYNQLREVLQKLARDYRSIKITRATPEMHIEGNNAVVIDTFGTYAEPFDPVQGSPINLQGKVVINMRKEPEGWKIISWGSML